MLILVAFVVVWPLIPPPKDVRLRPRETAGDGTFTTLRAVVVAVEEEGVRTGEDGLEHPYQKLRLRLVSGDRAGEEMTVEQGLLITTTVEGLFQAGDEVYLEQTHAPEGERFLVADYVRTRPLLLIGGLFVGLVVLVSGGKGVRSLVGTCLSILVIFAFIVPQIVAGHDPLLISLVGAVFLITTSTYLTFGWNLKAHAAVMGMMVSLAGTGVLASVFLDLTRLSGLSSEESTYLLMELGSEANLKGILLGGIIIGALGVLDDICVGQASSVFELASANRDLSGFELFRRGLNIGRDHISAAVNTLVLAYAGAAMPLFLVFTLYQEPLLRRLSREPVTEEIVRSLVGSIGLVIAVPATNLIASLLAQWQSRQRETLLAGLLDLLHRRGRWRAEELAAALGQLLAVVTSALEELSASGYLRLLPREECSGDCGRCGLRLACSVGFAGKGWTIEGR